ncbi:MAG: DUF2254 domain-containing protein [Burkholderiales bacterium]
MPYDRAALATAGRPLGRSAIGPPPPSKDTMFYRLYLWLKDGSNRLWVKPALGSVFAIAFALFATLTDKFVPADTLPSIDVDTIKNVLTVIASSMLAVTTFSLSIMVASLASVASGASPRATELVMGDDNTQNAIAAFISAFIYAVIAQIALGIGFYGPSGRFVLFVATVLVLLYLIYTLVVWVKTLSSLGRMGNTLNKVEQAATESMLAYRRAPRMGAGTQIGAPLDGATVLAGRVGHVRYIDLRALQKHAAEVGGKLHIRVRPGSQVYPGTALLNCEAGMKVEADLLREAFIVGPARTYRQDPRFGLIVLSEVAQRALSPAVNDPGTAIAVLNTIARVLIDARPNGSSDHERDDEPPQEFDRLTMRDLDESDFITQSIDAIARDGAAVFEVQVRIQRVLAAIAASGSVTLAPAAHRQAARSMERVDLTAMLDDEKTELRRLYERLHASTELPGVR